MQLSFRDYYTQKSYLLGEMAQSRGDDKLQIYLDKQDWDFIHQAVAKGITPASALRTRYTLMLNDDNVGESGPVRFFGAGRRPFVTVEIERTHKKHLQAKLMKLGATQAAKHGFTPLKDIDSSNHTEYYDAAFSRVNAKHILDQNSPDMPEGEGKPIEINYGRAISTKVKLNKNAVPASKTFKGKKAKFKDITNPEKGRPADSYPEEEPSTQSEPETILPDEGQPEEQKEATLKPVPADWAEKYLHNLFRDKSKEKEVIDFLDMSRASGKRNMLDFSDVWRAVSTLVGDTDLPDKYILPEVWQIFEKHLPEVGQSIYGGVVKLLKKTNRNILEDVLSLKQAMMQTTAIILSNPIRGKVVARTGNFLQDVDNLLADPQKVFNMATTTTTVFARRQAGVNTNNALNSRIGWEGGHDPDKLKNIGKEDQDTGEDTASIYDELEKIDGPINKILAKLQRYGWDFHKLSEDELELYQHYEQLLELLKSKESREDKTKKSKAGGTTGVRMPTIHPQQERLDKVRNELNELEPKVQPVIAKLDAANWNTSSVSDAEWDLYAKYEKLQKELGKLEKMQLVDVDDMKMPVGQQHRVLHPTHNEVAGAVGTLGPLDQHNPDYQVEGDPCSQVILGFNAWCKKRQKRGDGTGKAKKSWDGI